MFFRAGAVGGGDCGLDVGENRVDRLERGVTRGFAARARDDRLMPATRIGDSVETTEPVGDDCKNSGYASM